uniref:GS catalytic domain-containing protein n=1 Tax=Globisporangium ultimum (strain ATCC 200006 / CBS 805.95 / DAOM BR144) TaxID=431595 RepID=K3WJ80_GLOUD
MAEHAALLWVDNSNVTRCRVMPMTRFAQSRGVHLTNAVQSMPSMYDAALDSPAGDIVMGPDNLTSPLTYDISAWLPGAVACFGDMKKHGKVWDSCSRSFLRRQELHLRTQFHMRATVGFELEFQLLKSENSANVPVDQTLYCEVKALQGGVSWRVLQEIVACLQKDLGINVLQYHPESASGQFEISIGHEPLDAKSKDLSLVDAVDQLVLARQTVRGIAAKHGLHATFVPKLREMEAGSGAHIHLGLRDIQDECKNAFQTRPEDARAFVAGVLEELPGMMLLLAPSINSYERLRPSCWAGAYACYGFENREAAIRLIGGVGDDGECEFARADHFEIKATDATANPYVAVGALLAAGMRGMKDKCKLPEPIAQDPATLPEADRPALLPQSLSETINAFQMRAPGFWEHVLSESYCSLLHRLRAAENEHYGAMTREEMVQALVNRY